MIGVHAAAEAICDGSMPNSSLAPGRLDLDGLLFECELIDIKVLARERAGFVLIQRSPGAGVLIGLLDCRSLAWRNGVGGRQDAFLYIAVGNPKLTTADGGLSLVLPCDFEQTVLGECATIVVCELDSAGSRLHAPPNYESESGARIRAESMSWESEVEVARSWSMSRRMDSAALPPSGEESGQVAFSARRLPARLSLRPRYEIIALASGGTEILSEVTTHPVRSLATYLGPAEAGVLVEESNVLWSAGSDERAHLYFSR